MTPAQGVLSPPESAVVRLSAALAGGDPGGVRAAAEGAALAAPPELVEEALLQSHLFLGYPTTLNAFTVWRAVSGCPAPHATQEDDSQWSARGEAVCRVVYGSQYARLRENVRALHPDLERWMIREGYGRVLGRPAMSLELRELCIVGLLAVLDAPRQLHSHLRGALNAGSSPERVEAALEVARVEAPERAAAALKVWSAVERRSRGTGHP